MAEHSPSSVPGSLKLPEASNPAVLAQAAKGRALETTDLPVLPGLIGTIGTGLEVDRRTVRGAVALDAGALGAREVLQTQSLGEDAAIDPPVLRPATRSHDQGRMAGRRLLSRLQAVAAVSQDLEIIGALWAMAVRSESPALVRLPVAFGDGNRRAGGGAVQALAAEADQQVGELAAFPGRRAGPGVGNGVHRQGIGPGAGGGSGEQGASFNCTWGWAGRLLLTSVSPILEPMDKPAKMEARAATVAVPRGKEGTGSDSRLAPLRRRPAASGTEDPYRLGFRERAVTAPDGRTVLEQIPLTLEDLVYPQEGDVVADGFPHNWFLHPLADAIRRHLGKRPATLVTCSTVLVLGDGKNAGPDVAVIEGNVDLSRIRRAINLRAVGGRLVFALEAVSTSEKEIRDKDLEDNVVRYAEEGVAEYLTVFPVVERRVKNLVGRRLSGQGKYERILPDAAGRVFSEQTGLYFYIEAESEELVAVDAETSQRLLTSDEEEARADREGKARRQEAEARRQEAEARRQAEERAEQEAEARREAEERAERAEERAEQALRTNVEDLCGLLGIEWSTERSTLVAGMGLAQLEALRRDLLSHKRWP